MPTISRRSFLAVAGASFLPGWRVARSEKVYRVGALVPMAGAASRPYLRAMHEQLAAHGIVEGKNLQLAVRHANNPRAEAKALVAAKPDALFGCTAGLARALARATQSIPIVFAWVADPVHSKLVESYARPGGNVTGIANRYDELAEKRVELLHEMLPSVRRISVVAGAYDEGAELSLRRTEVAAARLGLALNEVHSCAMWSASLGERVVQNADAALVITPFAAFGTHWNSEGIARYANERRLPAVFADRESVELGGLASYGNSFAGDFRQAAGLLAKVLRGEGPARIPVELSDRFEIAVNLQSSRAVGIEIPRSIMLRADHVVP